MDLGDECVKVLWTGGWDSTFRLLDVVLVHGASVQPFYVLDTARRSSIVELNTMQRIRRSVAAISQKKAALIRPSTIVSIHDIRPDRDITDRYVRLKARSFLGEQYDWLARFGGSSASRDSSCASMSTTRRTSGSTATSKR